MAADLHKQDNDIMNWEKWMCNHASLFLFICIFLLFMLVLAVIVAMFNLTAAAPTATEANLWYNNLEAII